MNKKLKIVFIINFFLSVAYALTAYINSTFLELFVRPEFVGLIFSAAALLAIVGLSEIPKLLSKIGNYRTSLWILAMWILSLMGLALFQSTILIILTFISYIALGYFFVLSRDIYVERFSEEKTTGKIRGTLFTIINLGWVFAPFIAVTIIESFGYRFLYLAAALLFIPALILLISNLRKFEDKIYERIPFWRRIVDILSDKDLRDIYLANFLLQFFYSWMIIYMPIYLHQYLHFEWADIGLIFVIMLLPFVFLQYPLGALSDKIGEKKMLYGGFMIMIISTIMLSFIPAGQFWFWAIALFATRVGAATVEIMTESYFFKKVTEKQGETIGFYRNTGPISFILGPILAGLFIFFFPIQYLFLALGIIMLLGIYFTNQLEEII